MKYRYCNHSTEICTYHNSLGLKRISTLLQRFTAHSRSFQVRIAHTFYHDQTTQCIITALIDLWHNVPYLHRDWVVFALFTLRTVHRYIGGRCRLLLVWARFPLQSSLSPAASDWPSSVCLPENLKRWIRLPDGSTAFFQRSIYARRKRMKFSIAWWW